VVGDHSKITAGPLFERIHARFEITHLGTELPVTLGELIVFTPLRRHCPLETIQLPHSILGQPDPELQEDNDQSKGGDEPLHGRNSLTDSAPRAKVRRTRRDACIARVGQVAHPEPAVSAHRAHSRRSLGRQPWSD
jgi:hypothetical protein